MLQPVDLLIKNGTLVTMDKQRRIIENGAIAIQGAKIVLLGHTDEVLQQVNPKKTIEARGHVVIPGVVDTHGHRAMTIFRGLVEDQPLENWLGKIWKMEEIYTSPENMAIGTQVALMEMISGGTTCATDMYFEYHAITETARQANFRLVNGPPFTEIKGLDGKSGPTMEEALEYLDQYKDDPLIHPCVQTHSTYTAGPDLCEAARRISESRGVLFITHASESRTEVETVTKRYGKTPIELLYKYGLLGERTLLAHCVHLRDDEIQLLAETKTSVAHCPSANLKLASGIARITDLMRAGVNIAIGTDSPACNNDTDMFHEAQLAALMQKGVTGDPTVMRAEDVFAMMTINGARAIGMGDQLGSLEGGKLADIAIIDFDQPHLIPCYDLYSHLIYAVNRTDVRHVIINGKLVMEDRNLLTLNAGEIKERMCRLGQAIRRSSN